MPAQTYDSPEVLTSNGMPQSDLLLAFDTLKQKSKTMQAYWDYYLGDATPKAITEKLQEIADALNIFVHENWAEVTIDAVIERITLSGLSIGGDAPNAQAQEDLNRLILKTQLLLEADDAHRSSCISGESYMIVWRESGVPTPVAGATSSAVLASTEEADEIQLFLNDARMCHIFYRADNPKKPRVAAKWWITEDGYRRITLYYPDHIEMWISRELAVNVQDGRAFQPLDGDAGNLRIPNPFGMIPVFHLQPDRLVVKSDLKSVIPIQNGITMLIINLMTSSEFAALPQKWIITDADPEGDGLGNLVLKVPGVPNTVLNIPASDGLGGQNTQVGQFAAGDLSGFIRSIEHFVNAIATITRIPKHFFFTQSGDPSGESLIAMESSLTKKAQRRIDRYTPVWRELGAFLCKLLGYEIDAIDLEPQWESVETVQPKTEMEIIQAGVTAGIPLVTMLRERGWTEARIERMLQDKREEQAQAAATLADALAQKSTQFNKGDSEEDAGSNSPEPKAGQDQNPNVPATKGATTT